MGYILIGIPDEPFIGYILITITYEPFKGLTD